MTYTNLHCHSYYSIDGLSSPEKIIKRCQDLNMNACAITDHGTLSGVVEFIEAANKAKIKPILGVELYLCNHATERTPENRKLHHAVVLAKNLEGWKNLIKATSRSNDKDVYYYRPRLDYELLKNYSKNLIAISGHPGSALFNCLFKTMDMYDSNDITYIESCLVDNPLEAGKKVIELYKSIFDDFFIEVNMFDSSNSPALIVAAKILRELGQLTNTKCVAICDSHYANPDDVDDHRVIICSMLKTTLRKVQKQMDADEFGLGCFFRSDKHYIPEGSELLKCGNTQEELDNTNYVASICETYTIFNKPVLPKFANNENELLLNLCRKGYVKKKKDAWNVEEYGNRVKYELDFIQKFDLAGYFLIVQDYVNFAKQQNVLVGPARGSCAASLVSYLIGITEIDPIPPKLFFERFLNPGRYTKDNIEYPDIDMDFPSQFREKVIEYITEKYGRDCVSPIATYGRLLGPGALKEVLRVHEVCSFEEMNRITKHWPQEAEITDELEKMEQYSIIRWILENQPEKVQDYCRLEDGKLVGDYAQYFEQAIRLEGVIKTQGKHAAGLVIAPHKLSDYCPMIYDKGSEDKIAGLDMHGLQKLGYIKFDILGLACLDKLMMIRRLIGERYNV